jgi:hypothetical protein
MRVIAGLALILGLTGCADKQETEQRWGGADPHFRAVGALEGADLDLDDLIEVICALDWEVPLVGGQPRYEQGRITELHAEGILGDSVFELDLERDELLQEGTGLIVFEKLPESVWFRAHWSPVDAVTLTFTVPCEEGTIEFVP